MTKRRGRLKIRGSECRSFVPRLDARCRCGLLGNLGTAVGPFSNKRLPEFSNGEPRKRSAVHRVAIGTPAPSRSLPVADPSKELLEGVPKESQDQQEKAGQDSNHSGNGSGTQSGADIGDHLSHCCQVFRFSGYSLGIPRTEKSFDLLTLMSSADVLISIKTLSETGGSKSWLKWPPPAAA
jgi:hypothetical protein